MQIKILLIFCLFISITAFAKDDRNLAASRTDAPANERHLAHVIGNSTPPTSSLALDAQDMANSAGARQSFRDCEDCPEMVMIPAGQFHMGSAGEEAGRSDDEGPLHEVAIRKFALGKYEVTVGEFRKFVQATGYKTDAEKNTGNVPGCFNPVKTKVKIGWIPKRYWDSPGFTQGERHPAVCLSWNDASAYVTWLEKETGKSYRLPSEAEWEYAARAGTDTARYWGDDPNQACLYANVADHSEQQGIKFGEAHKCNDGYFFTAPVGSYQPNAFGLQDMLGSALEWVADGYHDSYGGAPTDGSVWAGADGIRVLRGGSWNNDPRSVRAAIRTKYEASNRCYGSGFRLARTLP